MYSLIILGIVALVLLLSAGHAALFGFPKARARIITVVSSAIAAFGITLILKALLPTPETLIGLIENNMDLIGNNLGEGAVDFTKQAIEFAGISPTLIELVIQIIGALVLPLVCVALFCIIAAVAWIVYLIVDAVICHSKKKNAEAADEEYEPRSKSPRWAAALLGLAQGVVIVAVLFIPLSGYLAIAQPTLDELAEQEVIDTEDPVIHTVTEAVTDLNTSFTLSAYRTLGGNLLTNSIMNMRVADTKVNLPEELGALATLVQHVTELSQTEFADYSEEQAEIIRALGDSFGQSKLLSPIIGDVLYAATDAWLNGEEFIGIAMPSLGEEAALLDPMVTALLEILHDDAKNTLMLQADVKTTAELVAILAQNSVFANLSDTNALLGSFGSDGTVVSSLVTTLGSNESMKRLIPEIMNLGVRAIGQVLNVPVDTQAVHNVFMDTVASTINDVRDLPEQDRIHELSSKLNLAFDLSGLDVDSQVMDLYATAMLHDLVEGNTQAVTAADVQAFFVLYAESANNTVSTLSAKPTFDMLANNKKEDRFAGTVYQHMSEAQRGKSGAAAVGDLCVKLSKVDESNAAEQSKTLITQTFTDLLGNNHAALEIVINVQITAPIPATTFEHTASMQSIEEMKKNSTIITLENLLINAKEAASKINADTIQLDAEAISAIFSTASNLLDVLNNSGELDLAELANSIGTILDSLSKTETFGKDKTADLFTSVLQSETVREKANLDVKTATNIAKKATDGDVNYTQTMSAIAGSVNIMEALAKDGSISEEEMVNLIRNLNAQTAGMIEVYVTPERLVEHDLPEEYSAFTSELIKSLFGYVADSDKQNSEVEAKALNQILTLALAAKESDEKRIFTSISGGEQGRLPTATETINTLLDSKAVRHALVDTMTDGKNVTVMDPYGFGDKISEGSQDYIDCVAAIHAYRNAHPEVNDLVFESLAAMMGVKVDL